MNIKDVIENPGLLEIGRKAVEDVLVERRDARISLLNRGNGLVIYEPDRNPSHIIRMGTEEALAIALQAILEHESEP